MSELEKFKEILENFGCTLCFIEEDIEVLRFLLPVTKHRMRFNGRSKTFSFVGSNWLNDFKDADFYEGLVSDFTSMTSAYRQVYY